MKLIYDGQELEAGGLSQEAADGRYLQLSGGRVTGPVEVPSPTAEGQAATKGYVDEALTGKLDKTATAAAATKLAAARTIRTNLASSGAASFNGTANVSPGVTGTLPVANGGTGATTAAAALTALGAMPAAGGTMTGDLRIKGSGNYGTKINLGDGDYVHFYEPTDDCLEIKAKKIDFVLSDTSAARLTINGVAMGLVPSGCIMIWSGTMATIPTGWVQCNGENGTPDLGHCIVRGAINTTQGTTASAFYVTPVTTGNYVPKTVALYYIMKL